MWQAAILAAVVAMTPASGTIPNVDPNDSAIVEVEPLCEVVEISPADLAERMPTDLKHLAADVVRICRENEVNCLFVAAVMRWERRPDLHNYFGWMTAEGKLKRFDSDLDCLEWVIPRLKRLYLEPSGRYYHGATVEGVSICYNNNDVWRENVKRSMEGWNSTSGGGLKKEGKK